MAGSPNGTLFPGCGYPADGAGILDDGGSVLESVADIVTAGGIVVAVAELEGMPIDVVSGTVKGTTGAGDGDGASCAA